MDLSLAVSLWLEAKEAEGRSLNTIQTYAAYLKPIGAYAATVEDLSPMVARRYFKDFRVGHAPDTVRASFVACRAFLNWCVQEGIISESPVKGMRQPKSPETVKETYGAGQLKVLFAHLAAVRTPTGLRNHAICAVLLDCGLRASELCRLSIADLTDGALIIRKSKSGRPRIVPLGSRANKAMERYLAFGRPKLHPNSDALFVNQFGNSINRWGLQSLLDRLAPAVGFHLNAHRFRHTFATMHLRAGTPMETVRKMGGWADYAMLLTYTHLLPEDLADAQRRASPLDGI